MRIEQAIRLRAQPKPHVHVSEKYQSRQRSEKDAKTVTERGVSTSQEIFESVIIIIIAISQE